MDIRSIFEAVMASGGYNTSLINDWVNYANSVGIDRALQDFKQNNPGSGGLTTNITPYLTTSQQQQQQQQQQPAQSNVRSIFETVMASGGYNTSLIDDWVSYANSVGLDRALQDFKQNNPGSGGLTTNISPYLTTAQQQPAQQQPAQQQKTVVSNNRVVAANGNRGSFVTYSDGSGEIIFDNGARHGATASGLQAAYGFIPESQFNQQQAAQQQPVQQQPVQQQPTQQQPVQQQPVQQQPVQQQPVQQQPVQQQPVQQQPVQQQPDVRDVRSTLESVMVSSGYNTNLLDDWVTYANQVGLDKALADFRQNNPVIQQQPVQQQPTQQQPTQQQPTQQQPTQQQPTQQQPTQQFNEAEARRLLEGAAKSGGYTTELDWWVDYARNYGTEKALADYAIANPGVGGLNTDAFSGVASLTANRVLNQPITTGGLASAIPAINLANLYQQAPAFAPVSQTPSTLRQPLEAVDLVAEPQIYPQFGAPIQYIDAQTGLITPVQTGTEAGSTNMAGGGTVNFQEGGVTPLSPAQLGSTFDVSEYIDPETGRFYVNEFQRDVVFNPELSEAERKARESMTLDDEIRAIRNMNIRKGLTAPTPVGITSANVPVPMGMFGPYQYQKGYEFAKGGLARAAQDVAAEGRRGDSMLVHMTPGEVAGLQSLAQQMGGSLTINPETGLPEANIFKKLLPIVAAVAAPYLAPAFGAFAPLAAGAAAGVGTMLGGGSFREGLTLGLTSAATAGLTSGIMGANPLGLDSVGTGQSTFNLGNIFGSAAPAQQTQVRGPAAVNSGAVDVTDGLTADELLASGRGEVLASPATLQPAPVVQGAASGAGTKAAEKTILGMSPTTALVGGTLAMGALGGAQEQEAYQKQFEEAKAEQRRRRQLGYDAYARSGLANIPIFTGASGGPVALAGGGMTYMEAGGTTGPTGAPRDVTGTGDGMSDSVPATIEGVQEARLADGEFVVPADVVADIGNGSSDAGSKKLYDMMDRIRKARHGTTEQPPEINAEALMPA